MGSTFKGCPLCHKRKGVKMPEVLEDLHLWSTNLWDESMYIEDKSCQWHCILLGGCRVIDVSGEKVAGSCHCSLIKELTCKTPHCSCSPGERAGLTKILAAHLYWLLMRTTCAWALWNFTELSKMVLPWTSDWL
jgi:hypothetical protein